MKSTRLAPIIFITAVLVLPRPQALSQDPPVEWGEIPRVDLEMKSYPPEPDAPAVILADYGVSQINPNFGVTFTRHMRIKILTEAGYSWGNHVIPLYTSQSWDKLKMVEGVTYSLKPDGTIQETELQDDAVFEEKVDEDRTNFRFTLPALQPGSVIEFRYTLIYAGGTRSRTLENFPQSSFNHVIVCAPMGRDSLWLECTSQEAPFGWLGAFTENRPALLLAPEGGILVRTPLTPQVETSPTGEEAWH